MDESKPTVEDLRSTNYEEMISAYHLKPREVRHLNNAIDPNCFPIITNHKLSIEKMAAECNVENKREIVYRRAVLIKLGLDIRKEKATYKRKSPKCERVFSYLQDKAATYEEICSGTNTSPISVHQIISKLKKQDEVDSFEVKIGRTSVKYASGTTDLFPTLSKKALFTVKGKGKGKRVGERLTKDMPEKITPSMRRSSIRRLKKKLWDFSEEALVVVEDYVCKHSVSYENNK